MLALQGMCCHAGRVVELRCDACGMVRAVPEESPCADVGCDGRFRSTAEPRGVGGSLGEPLAFTVWWMVATFVLDLLRQVLWS